MTTSQSILRKIFMVAFCLICSSSLVAASDTITSAEWGTIINLAGRQRMLNQKMSKEFLLIAKKSNPEANRLNLQETYALFDRTLKGLMDGDATLELPGTTDQAIRAQLGKVQSLWQELKSLMEYGAQTKFKVSSR